MRNLYSRLNVSPVASTAEIQSAIASCSNASIKADATEVLLSEGRRRDYDRLNGTLTDIGFLRAALGLSHASNWRGEESSEYTQPSGTAHSKHAELIEKIKQTNRHAKPQRFINSVGEFIVGLFRLAAGFAAVIGVIWLVASHVDNFESKSQPPPGPKPYQATPAPVKPAYERPTTAPNGKPWPSSAGYVSGYQKLHADGLSTVTVDNSRNDSDVFVKLVSLDSAQAYPVRQLYIPAYASFTLNKVTAGSYDIRYRDLSSGGLSRSEAFNVEETQTYDGTQYSNFTMTLYKVQNGNMQTYRLSESEF